MRDGLHLQPSPYEAGAGLYISGVRSGVEPTNLICPTTLPNFIGFLPDQDKARSSNEPTTLQKWKYSD